MGSAGVTARRGPAKVRLAEALQRQESGEHGERARGQSATSVRRMRTPFDCAAPRLTPAACPLCLLPSSHPVVPPPGPWYMHHAHINDREGRLVTSSSGDTRAKHHSRTLTSHRSYSFRIPRGAQVPPSDSPAAATSAARLDALGSLSLPDQRLRPRSAARPGVVCHPRWGGGGFRP